MEGLMQDWPLLVHTVLDHASKYHGDREIVSRTVEGPIHRYTYKDLDLRSRALASAAASWFIAACTSEPLPTPAAPACAVTLDAALEAAGLAPAEPRAPLYLEPLVYGDATVAGVPGRVIDPDPLARGEVPVTEFGVIPGQLTVQPEVVGVDINCGFERCDRAGRVAAPLTQKAELGLRRVVFGIDRDHAFELRLGLGELFLLPVY